MNAAKKDKQTAPHQRRLPPLLRHAWYALNQSFRRRINHLNITPDQFTILRWLHEHAESGLTQRGLADLMSSDANTIASLLARMEAAELITRRKDETDRRANRVNITALGRRQFEKALDIAVELQNAVLKALPANKRDDFLSNLEVIAERTRQLLDES